MAVERPTFHEAWYRVAKLHPRLLSSVQVYRQHFRGRMWHVLENPTNNKFFRLSNEAYRFVALLDGKRTVADAWRICNEQLADNAPTQGEVIQLLGQLYCSNLLYAELAPDTENLFNRYRQRVKRQVQSFLTNVLFVRIPLIDPDRFLDRWVHVAGWLFGWFGLLLWLVVVGAGMYTVVGNIRELIYQSSEVLAPDNLIMLYLSMVLIKVCHEFGHAFACKRFGRKCGSGGEVHVMGVMFLVFVPLPYVDASSAWAFRKKWHRVVVGISGVMVELFFASIAAIVWANTSAGTVHIIAYNIIFVASISTLVFNGNPLLRFDAYYVLSDLLEIPNLSQRSRSYIQYLIKRHLWKVKGAQNPANSLGERLWFVFYGTASTAYRVFICIRILLFLNRRLPEELFILVPIFATAAIIAWVGVPVWKFFRYLFTSPELSRTRKQAIVSTAGALACLVLCLGMLKRPDYCRVEGIVEPVELVAVHAQSDGFVTGFLQSDRPVLPGREVLVEAANPELEAEKESLVAQRRALEIRRRIAETREIAASQILAEQIAALDEKIARTDFELSSLRLRSAVKGTWISPDIEKLKARYLRRGQRAGLIASLDDVFIRATAGQSLAALIVEQAFDEVEIRVKGRPDVRFAGRIEKVFPAGLEQLPSEALGHGAGGSMPTVAQDSRGLWAAEKFFEVRIRPEIHGSEDLLPGQRVVARIRMPSKPLAFQWWRSLRQLFQRRFHI